MAFSSQVITLEFNGHVATLWLDRPDARNALGSAFWRDLPLAVAAIAATTKVRVLVIAAKGPSFTVGLDLKEFGGGFVNSEPADSAAAKNKKIYASIRVMQQAVTSISELEIPVIAAVHGHCIGGGVDLISACDIRLCSDDATFSVREAKFAIVADLGTLQRLPRIVSAGQLAELAFTGRDIDATRAATIGLVNSVHGHGADDVLSASYELANEIAANSPLAVRGTKVVLGANDGRTISEGLEFVARWNAMYLHSSDLREAMVAFLERRAPNFTGN